MIRTAFFALVSAFVLTASASATPAEGSKVTHTLSPEGATIRFEGRDIRTLSAEQLQHRSTSCQKILQGDTSIYDQTAEGVKVLMSSDSPNLIHTGVNNGLAGAMFEAYANHIPLTLRPDDVWLSITAAFGLYVRNHAELMRKVLVTHEGKQELVVEMAGSLATSDQAFWTEFTRRMLGEMKKYTNEDLGKWLVPEFSTTTQKDQLVGQVVMMGAMKDYFEYSGVLSSALTQLTLKGRLADWQALRARAAKLADYGGELAQWSETLLPVLDHFVAAYEGKVDEAFWQRMITYRRLGSGGQKEFRGWFVVFAPFNGAGKYYLNSKKVIDETGIYATVQDSHIQTATVAVPVKLNDNGVKHDLVFWGGVSLPAYDAQANMITPSVDWAIVDKATLPKPQLVRSLVDNYGEWKWVPEKYRPLVTEKEFEQVSKERKLEREQENAKREAERAQKRAELLKGPKADILKFLMKNSYWTEYKDLDADFRKAVTKKEFDAAKEVRKVELEEEKAKREAEEKAREQDWAEAAKNLPKEQLLEQVAKRYGWRGYANVPAPLQALVTEAEFTAAVETMKAKERSGDTWE